MANFIQLKHPPIKEIIFTISFDENVKLGCLDKFIELPEIVDKYSNISKGFYTNIREKNGQKPEASISNDGYILRTNQEGNRVLQARRGSFSFHVVKDYEKFEVLLKEFKEYWLALEKCTGELSVNNIGVRYVNFIEKGPDENNQQLVTINLDHPFPNNVNEFIHLKFNYSEDNDVIANIIIALGKDNSRDGIILDIILNKKLNKEREAESIFQLVSELRQVKNDLFFKCITEKTIIKYN